MHHAVLRCLTYYLVLVMCGHINRDTDSVEYFTCGLFNAVTDQGKKKVTQF